MRRAGLGRPRAGESAKGLRVDEGQRGGLGSVCAGGEVRSEGEGTRMGCVEREGEGWG